MRRTAEVLREWRWFALAVLLAVMWLWSNRYQVVSCDEEGACIVMNRWTGQVGHKFTPLAADGLYEGNTRRDSAAVARMLRELGP